MVVKHCDPGAKHFVGLRGIGRILAAVLFLVVSGVAPAHAQSSEDAVGSVIQLTGPCGSQPLNIARMQWPSSVLLAYIHGLILERELGCQVQVVPGDLAASVSSMATTGQPAIAPEMWVTRVAAIWNSTLESGRVRSLASTFSGGALEGWYLPAHVAEAEPELSTAAQLAEYATRLAEEGIRPTFISCPPDWACSVINANLLRAHGLEDLFDVVEPGNRFEMDTLIAQSVSRIQPVVFYYWQPNSVLAQFEFKALDMGPFDGEKFTCLARISCRSPQASSFVPEAVFIVVSNWVVDEAPMVVRYLQRATMPIEEMNRLLAQQAEGGGSFEEVAVSFVDNRGDIWGAWLEGL